MKVKNKILIILLILEIIFLGVYTYINEINKENAFVLKTFSFNEMFLKNGEIKDETLFIDETFIKDILIEENGIICTYGPYMELTKGEYKLIIDYETNEENNYVSLYSNELLSKGFHSNKVNLEKDKNKVTLYFSLEENISDFEIHTNYLGKGSLKINKLTLEDSNVNIKNNNYAIYIKIIFLIIVFILLDLFIIYIYKNPNELIYFLILFMIGIFISSPAFLQNILSGHDIMVHVGRIYGIKDGLLDGEVFIKLQQNWLKGNGYIIGAFYGDFLLYIPAILSIFGIKMQTCYQLFYVIINLLTLFISYFSFKEIFKHNKIATIGSILYSCSIYRLMDMYLRHSVGEYCAFLFLPLIVLGFYKVFSKEENQYKFLNSGWLILSIAFAGLVNTHILSCEMVAIFIIISFLFFLRKFKKINTIKYALLTIITTLLLSASFIVPFLDGMILKGDTNVSNVERNDFLFKDRGIVLSQLFEIMPNITGTSLNVTESLKEEMPLTLGISFIIALGIAILTIFLIKNFNKSKILIFYIILSCLGLYMSTIYFPWDTIKKIPILENAISSIQFPWRFLSIASIFIVLSFMEALKLIKDNNLIDKTTLKIIPVSIILISLISAGIYLDGTNKRDDFIFFNNQDNLDFMITGEEYLLQGTNTSILDDKLVIKGETLVSNYEKDGLKVKFDITSTNKDEIQIPLLYYWYYKCTLNGKNLPIYKGENNVLTICIPPNEEGTIEIYWKNPISWNISFIITFIACIIVSFIILEEFIGYLFEEELYKKYIKTNINQKDIKKEAL